MFAHNTFHADDIVPIRSIDPEDDDFDDLAPIAEAVGNARVVMLGEAMHGDGATFLAKCRLIKFLHRRLGFDVLAWEGGMLDCRVMDQAIQEGKPLSDPDTRGIYQLWYASQQVQPILQYAQECARTDYPLEMAGFDHRFSSPAFPTRFSNAMLRFFGAGTLLLTPEQHEAISTIAARIKGLKYPAPQERQECCDTLEMMLRMVSENEAALQEAHGPREVGFHERLIRDLRATEELNFSFSLIPKGDYGTMTPEVQAVTERRDLIMGDNLVWLANEYYPGRKIVVWAASAHTMRNPQTVWLADGGASYQSSPTMGHEAHRRLGLDLYSIAFTSYEGKWGWVGSSGLAGEIDAAEDGSWEALLHPAGFPYSFISLRPTDEAEHSDQSRVARLLGHENMVADWGQVFDGLFFIDVMTPSTEIVKAYS